MFEHLTTWLSVTFLLATLFAVVTLFIENKSYKLENAIIVFIATFAISIFLLVLVSSISHLLS